MVLFINEKETSEDFGANIQKTREWQYTLVRY